MKMYKAGDKFEVVRSGYMGECVQPGDIVEYFGPAAFPSDKRAMFKTKNGQVLFFKIYDDGECTVRPLRTEAEKRGATFGVTGVNKTTGKRIVFNSVGYNCPLTGEEIWVVMYENIADRTIGIEASNIRLDHEPEYKEIPFSEATHEQMMDVSMVYNQFGKNPIEALHTAGGFYVYTFRENVGPTMVNGKNKHTTNLTIRIPA